MRVTGRVCLFMTRCRQSARNRFDPEYTAHGATRIPIDQPVVGAALQRAFSNCTTLLGTSCSLQRQSRHGAPSWHVYVTSHRRITRIERAIGYQIVQDAINLQLRAFPFKQGDPTATPGANQPIRVFVIVAFKDRAKAATLLQYADSAAELTQEEVSP